MVDAMKLHLESMGPINEANINIDKITIVAGHNSTGKSTLSKFLYSFLRSNSLNRQEISYESIANLMRSESHYISKYLSKFNKGFRPSRFSMRPRDDFDSILEKYEDLKSSVLDLDISDEDIADFSKRFNSIDDLIDIVENDGDELYISLMRSLLNSEFSTDTFNSFISIDDDFIIDFKNHDFNDDDAFKSDSTLFVNDVFYIDSVSFLDTFEIYRILDRKSIDHFEYLRRNLTRETKEVFDAKINKDIIAIEKEINSIINGKFIYERGEFKFVSNDDIKSNMTNTASGTKQIGLIQLLLANRKLKENSFLIIDEPEVNLHPEWQSKFAKILVLIAKKLNVSVYINTHSPLFIESVHAFSYYYDILDKTSYHLAISSGSSNLFDVGEIDESNLSEIYSNLGQPYVELDILRLEKDLD